MNEIQMVNFCRDFVSLFNEDRKTKTSIELYRTVFEGKTSNPANWFKDSVIDELYGKWCPVTAKVYKFVRDNQNLFRKAIEYRLELFGNFYTVMSADDPRSLQWFEPVYAADVDYYANPEATPLYKIPRFNKWTITDVPPELVMEFFKDGNAVKRNFAISKDGTDIAVFRGALITEIFNGTSLSFTTDCIH